MKSLTIRPAEASDLPAVAKLWHEKTVVQQQSDRRFTLSANSVDRWLVAAANWLSQSFCCILVAQAEDRLVGYIIGWVQDAPPGLTPERVGVITDLTIGLHSQQGGAGRALLDALRKWFAEQGVTCLLAHVPRRQPVEQAFWRALGATEFTEIMWLKLD